MGYVESNGGVHTGGGSNGIIGKWVLDPFCDGNSNRKKLCQIQTYMHFAIAVAIAASQCEHPDWIPQNPFMKEKIYLVSVAVENLLLMNTCNDAVAVAVTHCERALSDDSVLHRHNSLIFARPNASWDRCQTTLPSILIACRDEDHPLADDYLCRNQCLRKNQFPISLQSDKNFTSDMFYKQNFH